MLGPKNVFLTCKERLPQEVCLQVKLADFGMEWSHIVGEEEDEEEQDEEEGYYNYKWSREADVKAVGEIIGNRKSVLF